MLILGGVISFYMPFTNKKNGSIYFLYLIFNDPNSFFTIAESESLFWCIYGVVLVGVIFLFGKSLHSPGELDKAAILKDGDPYFIIKEVYDTLNEEVNFQQDNEKRKILYSLKLLKVKLSVEKDFGRGSTKITELENTIACELNQLQNLVLNHELQEKDWLKLQRLINGINEMMEKRSEWKKESN